MSIRVVHGFGQTCRFCCAGVVGIGLVSDLLTCGNTVPITGNCWNNKMYANDLILSYLMIPDCCGTVLYTLLFPPCVLAVLSFLR